MTGEGVVPAHMTMLSSIPRPSLLMNQDHTTDRSQIRHISSESSADLSTRMKRRVEVAHVLRQNIREEFRAQIHRQIFSSQSHEKRLEI